jgi:hypothetical protein
VALFARAENAVDETGTSDQAISAFLTIIGIGIENTGSSFVAGSHKQHHFVSASPVQKLRMQLAWATRGAVDQ